MAVVLHGEERKPVLMGEESSNIGCGMPTKHLLREWVMATEGDGGTKRSSDGREGTVVETKGSC